MGMQIRAAVTHRARTILGDPAAPDVQHNFTGGTLPSWVTFSRTAHGTYFDSTGKLTYAPNNLLTQTTTLSTWTQPNITLTTGQNDPFGGTNAVKAAAAASGSGPALTLNPVGVAGPSIIYSLYAKKGTSATAANLFTVRNSTTTTNLLSVRVNYDTGAITYSVGSSGVTATDVGGGWWRISLQPVSGVSTGDLITVGCCFNGSTVTSGDFAYIYGPQLEAVTYQTTPSTYVATTSAAYYGPRFDYDPVTIAPRGLLLEDSRTNAVVYNRDLTQNTKWTVSNITAAKDQTGLDGVSNSASSILATADNGTILQAITLASSARFQTAYVKRLVGSGAIYMTMDNGSTWTAITVTSGWTRVSIPTQTLANPTVGFKLATNTDKIAVDLVQNENGAFATSAIPTGASSYQRTFDSAYLTGAAATIAQAASGTAIMQTTLLEDVSTTTHYILSSASSRRLLYTVSASPNYAIMYNGTTTAGAILGSGSWTGSPVRAGAAWGASSCSIAANNGLVVNGSFAIGATASTVYLGAFGSQTTNIGGWLASMALYTNRITDSQLRYKTTVGAPY